MADLCIAALTGNTPGTELDAYVAQGGDVGPVFTQNGTDTYLAVAAGFYLSTATTGHVYYTDDTLVPASGVTLLTVGVTVHKFTNVSFNQNGLVFGFASSSDTATLTTYWDGSAQQLALNGPSGNVATVPVTFPTGAARRIEVDFDPGTLNAKLYFYDPAGSRVQVGTAGGYTVTGVVGGGQAVGVHGAGFGASNGTSVGTYVYDFEATYTSDAATAYTLTGPANAAVGVASHAFTVTPDGLWTATVTPSDGGAGGTFAPTSLSWTNAQDAKTFTYTPAAAGSVTVSVADTGGLSDPAPLSVSAYDAVTRPIYAAFQIAAGAIGWTVYAADGSVFLPRTTAGVTSFDSTALRRIDPPLPDDFDGVVIWDDTVSEQYSPIDFS